MIEVNKERLIELLAAELKLEALEQGSKQLGLVWRFNE